VSNVRVASPVEAPPLNPLPAITAVISPEPPPEPVSTVRLKVVPSPLVNVSTLPATEPVVRREPVSIVVPPTTSLPLS